MEKGLLIVCMVCCIFSMKAQQKSCNISGNIYDPNSKPIKDALIILVNASDSTSVKTVLSLEDGIFNLDKVPFGLYRIRVISLGYEKYFSDIFKIDASHTVVVLPAISLAFDKNSTKEIIISKERSFIEHKIDRTIVNVDQLISNAGSTAWDVLEKSPGVSIDADGVISLNGKAGVVIYIDDKPTYLSGPQLESYLRSLPSSLINQIELMPNPPARYDAAGTAGIINIRTKKSKLKGFNGSLNPSYIQGIYGKTNSSFNFNYRKNRLNGFASLSANTINSFDRFDMQRQYYYPNGTTSGYFLQNSQSRYSGQVYNAKIGMDYYLSDKSTIGIVCNSLQRQIRANQSDPSQKLNSAKQLDSLILANNNQQTRFKNTGINTNYRHDFGKGTDINADLDFLSYKTNNNQVFNNFYSLPNNTLIDSDGLHGSLPATINIYSARVEYNTILKNEVTFSIGTKASITQTDNLADYQTILHGITANDYTKSNHFLYKESIQAVYINASKNYKRLAAQVGLRLEHTIMDGHQLGNKIIPDSSFNRSYTNLFPTAFLNYKLDTTGHQNLRISYGRRINRPFYRDLNPFVEALNKFSYYLGNPFLNPSYSNDVELSYLFKSNLNISLGYNKTRDLFDEAIKIENGIYFDQPINYSNTNVITLATDGDFNLSKRLNFKMHAELVHLQSQGMLYDKVLDNEGINWRVQPILQYNAGKEWIMQMDGFYQSRGQFRQFISLERKVLNASISKKISDALTARVTVRDIFYSQINRGIIGYLDNTDANYQIRTDSRTITLSLSYRFGKNITGQRSHEANGADSEKERVK